jgi:hypothetical protein
MTALKNKYFKNGTTSEQNLFEKLKIESIQVMGREYLYLPRKVQVIDEILGEDVLSAFDLAIPVEAFMESTMGFEGDREIFSKFGLEVHNEFKLVMSQSRWDKEISTVIRGMPDILLDTRPQEGDLIYDPLTKFLMEIKFVDHDAEFYQIGKNYLYTLTCEAFQYSNEDFSTGVTAIDDIDLGNSLNILENQILTEAGEFMQQETCDFLILDMDETVTDSTLEFGTDFSGEAEAIDWSSSNPFSGL